MSDTSVNTILLTADIDIYSSLPSVSRDLTIYADVADDLTVQASGSCTSHIGACYGILIFTFSSSATVHLEGFRIRGGYTSSTGGISNSGWVCFMVHVHASSVSHERGCSARLLIVRNHCSEEDDASQLVNLAPPGPHTASITHHSTLTLTSMKVYKNQGGCGGGINNEASGVLTVVTSEITNNVAAGWCWAGGGVYNLGSLSLTNTTVSGNDASNGGGIINYDSQGATLVTHNCDISGNSPNDVVRDRYPSSMPTGVPTSSPMPTALFAPTMVHMTAPTGVRIGHPVPKPHPRTCPRPRACPRAHARDHAHVRP